MNRLRDLLRNWLLLSEASLQDISPSHHPVSARTSHQNQVPFIPARRNVKPDVRSDAGIRMTNVTTNQQQSQSSEQKASSNENAGSIKVGSGVNDAPLDLHSNVKDELRTVSTEAGKVLQASLFHGTTGNASMTFGDHATLEIHVGDRITSNPQQSQSYEQKVNEMLKKINRQMWNKIDKKIDVFQKQNLNEPESEVYPQIAESPNFYKGKHIVKTKQNSNSRRNEYIKEEMFRFERYSETRSVSFESVMQEFCQRQQPVPDQLTVFCLVAQAGAGKTTYMRNWAKRIMEDNGISPVNDYLSSADSKFKLLLYYNLNSLRFRDASKTTTLQELLFNGIFYDTSFAFNWLIDNEDRVVLFFDGLDQTPWTITEETETEIDLAEEANIPTILCNLLSRNCFSKSGIIISSREFKASALPYKARPQKVFTLTGFTSTDAESLFNTLVSQELHENPYEHFSKSSLFGNFLTIPMFLTFAACVYKSFGGFLPNSITALLAKVLELLQCSLNVQERENIWLIITKLKSLAHAGLKNGVVVFTKEELTSQGLNAKDACDLILVVPAPNIFNQCLSECDFTVFFCHQIIQEFLSACFIVELPLNLFSQFENDHLHDKRWTVVRQFVCGLLFLNSGEKFVKITDKEDKQRIIRKSLVRRISETIFDLELFASIYESNDDQLIRSIKKINLKIPTRDATHMISSLIARSGQLEEVTFGLSDELLNVMAANLENVKVRVSIIHLLRSQFSATAFNNFFKNIESDYIYVSQAEFLNSHQQERINWENIRCLTLNRHCSIIFSNRPNSIDVCVEEDDGTKICSGIFDKKNETIVFDREVSEHCCILQCQMEASAWLSSKSISINIKGVCTQNFQYTLLHDMEKWQNHVKVPEIVLNARYINDEDEESTVRDKMTSLVRVFQVQILNIAISLKSLHHFPLQLEHDLSTIGCEFKIHIVEDVNEAADLQKLILTLRESQVQYFRLVLMENMEVEDLISFIRSCGVTKQLVIILHSVFFVTLSDIEKQKLKDTAESLRINLTFEVWEGFNSRDAWSYF